MFMLQQFVNFSLNFYKVQISTNYTNVWENYTQSRCPLLSRSGPIFPVLREITLIKKYKTLILESNQEWAYI